MEPCQILWILDELGLDVVAYGYSMTAARMEHMRRAMLRLCRLLLRCCTCAAPSPALFNRRAPSLGTPAGSAPYTGPLLSK